ncbi:MAG: hypothetical protein ABI425_03305 [Patescibacteria group bacterium]
MENNRLQLPSFITKLFQKKWLRVFIVIMGLAVVISAILQALTPTPPPAETVVTTEKTYKAQITFDKNLTMSMPSKLAVYQALQPETIETTIQKLAKQLPLTPVPGTSNAWQDANQEYQLTTSGNATLIAYKKDILLSILDDTLPKTATVTHEEIAKKIRSFIDEHQLFQNYTLSEPEPQSVNPESTEPAKDEASTNAYKITLNTLVDNIPFISSDKVQSPAIIRVDKNASILEISFYPVPSSFEQVQIVNSLGLGGVEDRMLAGLITYIHAGNFDAIEPNAENLSNVEFSSATLEYRQNEQNGYILPYIHFYGVGKDKNNSIFNVEAISPAVKVE